MTLLRDLMLADLERGLAIARDCHEVVPAWRILASDGDFLILNSIRTSPNNASARLRLCLASWRGSLSVRVSSS
jgi:hypothetical protein